ncbi:hypothetical protein HFN72_18035 [Rhizobium laguerreae]|uniref:hypothetical protein n=1 Tax=Rhizobium laguerreae TaxID=1076926 RepID=UPI001C8FBC3A|nr:hypothetical protein [Rhizobium laguerreae]MBY3527836.1 hypothetical protein [Rhizobium laguerreae]
MEDGQLWLSLGVHNLIVLSHDQNITAEILDFCTTQGVDMETWVVSERSRNKYSINDIRYFRPSTYTATSNSNAAKTDTAARAYSFPQLPTGDPLEFTILELYALLVVIETRSRNNFEAFSLDCLKIEQLISELIQRTGISDHSKRDVMLGLNAGLSRLSSQALSGTSPISRTECHFWPHSLLGIGVANYALRNVADFISGCVRDTKFNQRFQALTRAPFEYGQTDNSVDNDWPTYFNIAPDIIANAASLGGVVPDEEDLEDVPNPITYYSGRDGFRNGILTTSAPLMSVSGCNSVQWNLGTITHELSHRILSGKLEEMFQNVLHEISDSNVTHLDHYFASQPKTMGQFAERLLAMSLMIKYAEEFPKSAELNEALGDPISFMLSAKLCYSEEIEEIAVHIFDYYHFYGAQHGTYVDFIWQSWAVQPSIEQRLEHYIKRTITALAVVHFRLSDWQERAISDFESILDVEPLKTKLPFYDQAKEILETRRDVIVSYLEQMQHVIALFHFILKLEDLKKMAVDDPFKSPPHSSGASVSKRNYTATRLVFGDDTARLSRPSFRNPLLFLRDFSTDAEPSAAKSAWLLHMLSFNALNADGTSA